MTVYPVYGAHILYGAHHLVAATFGRPPNRLNLIFFLFILLNT